MSDARALADDALDREADYAGYGETLEQLTIRAETAEARADALAEALSDLVAWADEQSAQAGSDALLSLHLRLDRARAALVAAAAEEEAKT